jgi:aryl-alcohol dehydrogenase-like predicted oxidoreductase
MNLGGRTPRDESERIIRRAIERGITFFDVANAYNDGESERIVGQAIAKDRDRCVLATKVGFGRIQGKPEGLSRAAVLAAVDASLQRLRTDRVDLYYLHVPDHTTPIEETLDAVQEILDKRKAVHWGVSNYASWQILEMTTIAERRGMPRPVMSQQLYNVLIRQLDVEYFKFTKKHPIVTAVYNPLAGGLLTGKHTRTPESRQGSRFENNKLYQGRYWNDAMFDRVADLAAVAHEEKLSLVELAYAWLAGRPGVDAIITGPATVAHLDSAIDACAKTLSAEGRDRIDRLYRAWQGTDASYAR